MAAAGAQVAMMQPGGQIPEHHLKDLQMMQRYRTVFTKRGGRQTPAGQPEGADGSKKGSNPGSFSSTTGGGQSSSGAESDQDFGSDYDKNFSENGSTSSLDLDTSSIKSSDLKTSEKCEKLEQVMIISALGNRK